MTVFESTCLTVCRSSGLHVAVTIAAWFALGANQVAAQPTCPLDSAATEYLAANGVTARLAASNVHFWFHEYEAPAGSNVRTLVFASPMFGGLVNGTLRMIAGWVSENQMRPGPLDQDGKPPPDCRPFNRVFKVTSADVLAYEETGIANEALTDWPWQLGAPVEDGDGIQGNYDLAEGDRPFVEGHEKLWWILNDVGIPTHLPLGVEVQTSTFALASDDPVLEYATFYRYHITYRGKAPLTDAYFGMQMFTALGESDNYLGSDTTLGLAYVYNGDDFDAGGGFYSGYGDKPAAFGIAIFDGILVDSDQADNDGDGLVDEEDERLPMTTVLDWQPLDPQNSADYYGYMQGYWRDGRHLTMGGSGRNFSEIEINFQYPGEPGEFWSAENEDGKGARTTPGDVVLLWSTGPFSMTVGESRDIVIAMLWAQGEDRIDSVRLLKESVPKVRGYYASGFRAVNAEAPIDETTEIPAGLAISAPYPNPASGQIHIDVGLPSTGHVTLTAFDLLGRRVASIADSPMTAGWRTVDWNTEAVSNGVYVVRLQVGGAAVSAKVVVVK